MHTYSNKRLIERKIEGFHREIFTNVGKNVLKGENIKIDINKVNNGKNHWNMKAGKAETEMG